MATNNHHKHSGRRSPMPQGAIKRTSTAYTLYGWGGRKERRYPSYKRHHR